MEYRRCLPFTPREVLLPTRAKSFQCPCPVPQIRPPVASAFVNEDELFGGVVLPDPQTVFGAGQLVALRRLFGDLRTSADSFVFRKLLTSFILKPTLCRVRQMVDSDTWTPHRSSRISRSSSRYRSLRRATVRIKNCGCCEFVRVDEEWPYTHLRIAVVQRSRTPSLALRGRLHFTCLLPRRKNMVDRTYWDARQVGDGLRVEKTGVLHVNDDASRVF